MARDMGRRRRVTHAAAPRRGTAGLSVGAARIAAVVGAIAGVVASGLLVWGASGAAFSGVTTGPASAWAAGTVSLTDDDGGTALFSATGLKPGSTGQRCIRVTYTGDVASGDVRLYSAAPTGTLGGYITLTVELGTVGTFASCGAFAASSTLINNVLLSTVGTKTDFAGGYSTGWTPAVGQSRVFRFTYTVSASTPDTLQGATCSMPFIWETQS
jgi:hypothetical protein